LISRMENVSVMAGRGSNYPKSNRTLYTIHLKRPASEKLPTEGGVAKGLSAPVRLKGEVGLKCRTGGHSHNPNRKNQLPLIYIASTQQLLERSPFVSFMSTEV
jgi:hypothetical protein